MTQIIDRRLNGKNKSAVNRQRFIQRFKNQIKQAVENAISKRSITDIYAGEKIIIPRKDISEPNFRHGLGGKREHVLPGNKEFIKGDKVKRAGNSAGGNGSEASNEGEGTDDFGFEINKDEFLDLFFEDLELPDLVIKRIKELHNFKTVRAGYSTKGTPPNINIVRSFKNAYSRRIAFTGMYKNRLKEAEEKLAGLQKTTHEDTPEIETLKKEIQSLKNKISNIPFIDEFDIRYNYRIKIPNPATNAVMFCIMDVSGSMDETKKEMAKRFFILLYLFLVRTYKKIDIVFIRHHTTAKEVDEEEFFYSRETGGTVVSSALELMRKIIKERYPTEDWNIYGAQASDGDNWNADSPLCQEILARDIIPHVQYFAYIEILPRHHQSLWRAYEVLNENFKNFSMKTINGLKEIYPVFHELFKRHYQ